MDTLNRPFTFFSIIATFTTFLILGLYFFHPIPLDLLNSDFGMHLTFGKVMIDTGTVPKINLLSYTYHLYPFINTHWLAEAIFYLLYKIGGYNSLIFLSILLGISMFALLFKFAVKRFDFLTTVLISLLSLQVLYGRSEIRPELLGYVILSLFLVILYTFREQYTKWIFLLIPLELLWVNFHIYYFVGIVVLVAFTVDALLDKNERFSKKFYTLVGVAFGCGLATFFNPNFFKGALYPLFVLNNYGYTVEENVNFFKVMSNPAYNSSPLFGYFILSVVILWTSMLLRFKKMKLVDYLLALFFTCFGFFAVRNFSLFILGTFITSVKASSLLMQSLSKRMHVPNKTYALALKALALIIVLFFIFPTFKSNIAASGIGFGVIDTSKNAIDFFIAHKLKGPIFNDFDMGNYLVYRLYPKEKVFVYASPEAFPKEFFQNIYIPMQKSLTKFNEEDNTYHFNTVILRYTETSSATIDLIQQLSKDDYWQMVYLDSSIVIFVKNIPENQAVIKSYAINQNNVHINEVNMDSLTKVGQLTNFFGYVHWDLPRANMIIQYLKFDPTNCSAIESIVYLLQKVHDPRLPSYINKYEQTCSQ